MRSLPPLPDWVALEHNVAQVLTEQELHGWYFDTKAAWQLASTLRGELELSLIHISEPTRRS